MRKQMFAAGVVLFGLLAISGVFGQGFTGPGSSPSPRGQGELVTAAAAKELRDDTRVTLQGTIVNQLSRERYTFRDSSGEITLEIDRGVWRGLTVGENEQVEIYGEIDRERRGTQIDVKTIKKL